MQTIFNKIGTAEEAVIKHLGGLWYLASPYSKYPTGMNQAYLDVCRIAAYYIERGIHVYSPIAHSHPIAIWGELSLTSYKLWMPLDETIMRLCKGMIIADMVGWDTSKGVLHEIEFMARRAKPIYVGITLEEAPING